MRTLKTEEMELVAGGSAKRQPQPSMETTAWAMGIRPLPAVPAPTTAPRTTPAKRAETHPVAAISPLCPTDQLDYKVARCGFRRGWARTKPNYC